MAVLTTQYVSTAAGGTPITFVAASATGDRVTPGNRTFFVIRNGGASSVNVTIDATALAFNNVTVPDTVVSVPSGATYAIPITREYTSPSDGLAGITYTVITSVTVAVVVFP